MRHHCIVFILCSIMLTSFPTQATVANSKIQKILIVVAMDTEANPIIQALQLRPLNHSFSNLPMRGYIGQQGKIKVLLMMNGQDPIHHVQNIGTEAATLTTYLGIDFFSPDLVISIGTAGGVVENHSRLTDIYFSEKIYFFDRRIPMKGYQAYGLGAYHSVSFPLIEKKLKLHHGIVCSGDSFDEEPIDQRMFLTLHCSAVDMEAAAVAWVSQLKKIPMIAIKGITNIVKGPHIHAQYEKNLPLVTAKLANALKLFILLLDKDHDSN